MEKYENPLSSVKIASPCSADWEDMFGNDRRRFCGQCELNVFNLSDMTKREAEELINQAEGRLCVRFYRRADGTILTRDCPVGLQAIKRRLSRLRNAVVSSVLSFLAGIGVYVVGLEPERHVTMGAMVAPEQMMGTTTLPVSDREPEVVMGGIPEIPRKPVSIVKKNSGKRRAHSLNLHNHSTLKLQSNLSKFTGQEGVKRSRSEARRSAPPLWIRGD